MPHTETIAESHKTHKCILDRIKNFLELIYVVLGLIIYYLVHLQCYNKLWAILNCVKLPSWQPAVNGEVEEKKILLLLLLLSIKITHGVK
jgi:hypothetical protein